MLLEYKFYFVYFFTQEKFVTLYSKHPVSTYVGTYTITRGNMMPLM
jgi:hypothetical protein